MAAISALLLAGCAAAPRSPGRPSSPGPGTALHFTDVAARMGLDYRWGSGGKSMLNIVEVTGAGAAFLDYDADGWLDIVLAGPRGVALYHNEQGRQFRNVTAGSGLELLAGRWYGCAAGDYDDDGLPDLVLTGYGRSVLLHNEGARGGGPRFRATTVLDGRGTHQWSTSAAFADVNHDGRLDLYVGGYVLFRPGDREFTTDREVPLSLGPDAYPAQKGTLFINQGGGRFRDATRSAGLDQTRGKCLGAAFADYDGDGWDDLYLANDQMPGDLFHNEGTGKSGGDPRFTNVGIASGTALDATGDRQGGMGVAWGDYDNDGRLDLFVSTFAYEPKSLYHNDDLANFSERSYRAGISQTTYPWVGFGTAWRDFNNDGWLDLVIANGHVQTLIRRADPSNDYRQRTQLFENRGDGTFRDVSGLAGEALQRPIVGRALAAGDFDNDGREDLLIVDLEGAPLLLRNESETRGSHWLTLDLRRRGGGAALGARVELVAGGRTQLREVRTDGSYLAASDPRVHFGLGPAERVDSLRIRWPGGKWQNVAPPAVDRIATLREP